MEHGLPPGSRECGHGLRRVPEELSLVDRASPAGNRDAACHSGANRQSGAPSVGAFGLTRLAGISGVLIVSRGLDNDGRMEQFLPLWNGPFAATGRAQPALESWPRPRWTIWNTRPRVRPTARAISCSDIPLALRSTTAP